MLSSFRVGEVVVTVALVAAIAVPDVTSALKRALIFNSSLPPFAYTPPALTIVVSAFGSLYFCSKYPESLLFLH